MQLTTNKLIHIMLSGLEIWKKNMIEPLKEDLLKLLLDGIHQDRLGNGQHNNNDVIRGVIQSFVSVQEYKKKGNLEVEIIF